MMGNPLFESYRRELRRDSLRRWAMRMLPVLGIAAVLALGWTYHVSTNAVPLPRPWVPLTAQLAALPPVQASAPATPASSAAAPAGAPGAPAELPSPPSEQQSGVAAVPQDATPRPTHVSGELNPNEHLIDLLLAQSVARDEADQVLHQLGTVFDPRRLRPGQKYELWRSLDGHLDRFLLQTSLLDTYEVVLEGGRFVAQQKQAATRTEVVRVLGTVETTVGAALAKAGERAGLATQLQNFFISDIDFSVNAHKGDLFKIIVEKVMVEDRFVRYGNILAAEYRGATSRLRGFSYTDPDGKAGVFDEQGQTRQMVFLRSPVPGHRITSGYNPRRMHPILHRIMPHNGEDFRTPPGTPVLAAADGEVSFVGTKGWNGLLVVLSHDNGYKTHYGHLSRVPRSLQVGKTVKKGQVVAYSGNTGLSTAPHLHYAISKDGAFVDPKDPPPLRVPGVRSAFMKDFLATIAPLSRDLDHMGLGSDALYGDLLITHP